MFSLVAAAAVLSKLPSELAVAAGVVVAFKVVVASAVESVPVWLVTASLLVSLVATVSALAVIVPNIIPPKITLPITNEAAPPPVFFFLIAYFNCFSDSSLNIIFIPFNIYPNH